jgi:hypothetical protein
MSDSGSDGVGVDEDVFDEPVEVDETIEPEAAPVDEINGVDDVAEDADDETVIDDSEEPSEAALAEAARRGALVADPVPMAAPLRPALDPMVDQRAEAIVLVPPEEWVTDDTLQLTEVAALLAYRAKQLEHGRHFLTAKEAQGLDCRQIAMQELLTRRFPLIIRRVVQVYVRGGVLHRVVEDRSPNEMAIPPLVKI